MHKNISIKFAVIKFLSRTYLVEIRNVHKPYIYAYMFFVSLCLGIQKAIELEDVNFFENTLELEVDLV